MKEEDEAELNRRFDYHEPLLPGTIERHQRWRAAMKEAARAAFDEPPSRERALALTALEEALMWGNAAIARPPLATE